jgi:hypothetical protein
MVVRLALPAVFVRQPGQPSQPDHKTTGADNEGRDAISDASLNITNIHVKLFLHNYRLQEQIPGIVNLK